MQYIQHWGNFLIEAWLLYYHSICVLLILYNCCFLFYSFESGWGRYNSSYLCSRITNGNKYIIFDKFDKFPINLQIYEEFQIWHIEKLTIKKLALKQIQARDKGKVVKSSFKVLFTFFKWRHKINVS